MTPEQRTVLEQYFVLEATKSGNWIVLKPHGLDLAAFRTQRLGRITDVLLFTIGETQRGRHYGLSAQIERIIDAAGLHVERQPSTAGNDSADRLFRGFALAQCAPKVLEQVVREVIQAVRDCL